MLKNIKYLLTTSDMKKMPDDNKDEIVICGKSNVGKSTLINKLGNNKKLAKTSSRPGKTRAISFFDVDDKFRLVDIPGYGYANVSKKQIIAFKKMIETFFKERRNLKKIILLLDIRRGLTEDDSMMINFFAYYDIPIIFIATKIDKANQSEIYKFEKEIKSKIKNAEIIKYSAISNVGLEKIKKLF
ncbi:MAG: putative GTP-binding protein EngB [Candidatus Hepatoplasma vulgare]|nr:MAG: putative GTP-binding protein EngB [Candidatus Hepatoplasma sp.]